MHAAALARRLTTFGADYSSWSRDGASVGYLLRKHAYGRDSVARMLVRPLGGIVVSLARIDPARASYHAATFRGRIRGYRGASRSKTSR